MTNGSDVLVAPREPATRYPRRDRCAVAEPPGPACGPPASNRPANGSKRQCHRACAGCSVRDDLMGRPMWHGGHPLCLGRYPAEGGWVTPQIRNLIRAAASVTDFDSRTPRVHPNLGGQGVRTCVPLYAIVPVAHPPSGVNAATEAAQPRAAGLHAPHAQQSPPFLGCTGSTGRRPGPLRRLQSPRVKLQFRSRAARSSLGPRGSERELDRRQPGAWGYAPERTRLSARA